MLPSGRPAKGWRVRGIGQLATKAAMCSEAPAARRAGVLSLPEPWSPTLHQAPPATPLGTLSAGAMGPYEVMIWGCDATIPDGYLTRPWFASRRSPRPPTLSSWPGTSVARRRHWIDRHPRWSELSSRSCAAPSRWRSAPMPPRRAPPATAPGPSRPRMPSSPARPSTRPRPGTPVSANFYTPRKPLFTCADYLPRT